MYKRSIVVLFLSLWMYFSHGQGVDDFFCKVSVNDIESRLTVGESYDTIVVDNHFPDAARYLVPNYKMGKDFESVCGCSIYMLGSIWFKKDAGNSYDYTKNDSIQIRKIVVKDKECIHQIENVEDLKASTIGVEILNDIRNDFLVRMKYAKIQLGRTGVAGVNVEWRYAVGCPNTPICCE